MAPISTVNVQITKAPGLSQPREWSATGFDNSFVNHGAPALNDRGVYPTDAAAYRSVLANPTLAIVDRRFLASGGGPPSTSVKIGDSFTTQDEATGRSQVFTVAALSSDDVNGNGVLFGAAAARLLFGARSVPNRAYLDVRDPVAFAGAF